MLKALSPKYKGFLIALPSIIVLIHFLQNEESM
jgi:hypothetical protein